MSDDLRLPACLSYDNHITIGTADGQTLHGGEGRSTSVFQ
jgi:hypothetical protein